MKIFAIICALLPFQCCRTAFSGRPILASLHALIARKLPRSGLAVRAIYARWLIRTAVRLLLPHLQISGERSVLTRGAERVLSGCDARSVRPIGIRNGTRKGGD